MRPQLPALLTSSLAMVASASVADAVLVPAGGEFQVNTYTTAAQYEPEVAPLSAGSFVVVWTSYFQDGSYGGIFGQRVDVQGQRLGTEFRVNTATPGYQRSPAVAAASSGSFLVVWEDDPSAIHCPGRIAGRLYDSTGAALTGEIAINGFTIPCGVFDADVAAIAGGDFLVVWQSNQPGIDQTEIVAQRISSTGSKVGTEFLVNSYTTSFQDDPAIASRSDGSFVVVWGGRKGASVNADVRGQRFDTGGSPLGTEFMVNTYTRNQQYLPRVAATEAGGFVVVWRSLGQDGQFAGAFGQRFDSGGSPAGTEFAVNTYTTGNQASAGLDIDATPSGDFVVTWSSYDQDGSYFATMVRGFAANGAPLSGEVFANSYVTNSQRRSAIAADANGDFVVVWDSFYQDGDYHAVMGRRFELGATATTTSTSTTTTSSTSTTLPGSGSCGDANGDTKVTATDALVALRTAVGTSTCELCLCDVNSSGSVTATDALAILRNAVGSPGTLVCVPCDGAVIGPAGGIAANAAPRCASPTPASPS